MDEKLFYPRIDDCVLLCERTNTPQFFGFLSETETALARKYLSKNSQNTEFFGGYSEAIRNFLCVKPSWCDEVKFPIDAVTFKYKPCYTLSHRDFLGAVMSMGIAREKVGDILVGEGICVLFAENKIAKHIISQVEKVGNVGVTLTLGMPDTLPIKTTKKEFSDTVSSNRLDAVVSALCNCSRSKAVELIEGGFVCLNSFISEKVTRSVNSGDVISVRKYGRFNILSVDELSKKGRNILKYEKYI